MAGHIISIKKKTLENNYFRQVLFTGEYVQLVVMCLQPGEDIGNEVHAKVDQFFRIEQGTAAFAFKGKGKRLVKDGDAVYVPSGTCHKVINTSKTEKLKLYTLYSPPHHPAKTLQKTKTAALKGEMKRKH